LDRAVPLAGALAGAPRRHPVQPADEAAGARPDAASARLPGPGGPHPQRGRLRRGRRSAVPLAAVRRSRALPARGGPGRVLRRTGQLAQRPRTRSVTVPMRPVSGAAHLFYERPHAPRIGRLRGVGEVIDLGAGADVGVWAGRTTTVTHPAT